MKFNINSFQVYRNNHESSDILVQLKFRDFEDAIHFSQELLWFIKNTIEEENIHNSISHSIPKTRSLADEELESEITRKIDEQVRKMQNKNKKADL